jgi:predicted permease
MGSDALLMMLMCLGYIALGLALRLTKIVQPSDGGTLIALATHITLPALLLHLFLNAGPLFESAFLVIPLASAAYASTTFGVAWMAFSRWPARERALMLGSAVGLDICVFA